MTQVQIVPNSKTGNVITAYERNPEFGYVQLQQSAMVLDGGWIREQKRSTLLRAKVDTLSSFVAQHKTLTLPGKIVVKEYVESEVPQAMAEKYFNKDASYEEALSSYVKRSGEDGIPLTVGGERIIRFQEYDPSGVDVDVRVSHDNVEAVREFSAAKKASASF